MALEPAPDRSTLVAGVLDGINRTKDGCNRRVLYLTRTHAQQRQVMVELRAIAKLRPAFGVALQGRVRSCFPSEEGAELAACDGVAYAGPGVLRKSGPDAPPGQLPGP